MQAVAAAPKRQMQKVFRHFLIDLRLDRCAAVRSPGILSAAMGSSLCWGREKGMVLKEEVKWNGKFCVFKFGIRKRWFQFFCFETFSFEVSKLIPHFSPPK